MTRKKRPAPACRAPDRIVLEDECEVVSGLSRMTRWRMEQEGTFPGRVQISENRVGWLESELVAWMRQRAAERDQRATEEPEVEAEAELAGPPRPRQRRRRLQANPGAKEPAPCPGTAAE